MMRIWFGLLLLMVMGLLVSGCQPLQVHEAMVLDSEAEGVLLEEMEPTILVEGASFHGANGIHFGPDGNLYIASVVGDEIVVMDPETGELLGRYDADLGVLSPDDLAFAQDGTLYFTSILTGKVGHITADDEVEYIAELTMGANPITFSDDGRLFVAQCFMDDKLYEIDPVGATEPRLISDQLGPGCGLNGMDWGDDGYLYGPRWFNGEVVRVDVDTGEFTTVADGFGVPAAVKFDSQGQLHVLDTMRGEIVEVDTETGDKNVIATLVPGLDNLAFDAQDRLYVSSFTDALIAEVLEDGTTRTVSHGGMIAPGGVAVMQTSAGESVFVADFFGLREYDAENGDVESFVPTVLGVSELHMPTSVAIDGEDLILSSWPDNVVWRWDPVAHSLIEEYRNVEMPLNAIRFGDKIIVAELGTGSVVELSGTSPEERTPLIDGLAMPIGFAERDGSLWVSDAAIGAVFQIAADGQFLSEPVMVTKGLAGPEGLAVADDGSLLVLEAGIGQLSRIDMVTGEAAPVAGNLALGVVSPSSVPTGFFNGVSVGKDGAVYVTGDAENLLYRMNLSTQ